MRNFQASVAPAVVIPAKAGIQVLDFSLNPSLKPGPRLSPGRRSLAFAGATMVAFAGMTMFLLATSCFAEGPHAFPVPFTPGRNASHTQISFTDLPGTGSIKIYTIDGKLVADLPIAAGQALLDWPVTNTKGEKVATGIYLYQITAGGQQSEGKLVVIR